MTVKTGDGSNKVEGNGKVISEAREVPEFNEIRLEGVFNVFLSMGEKATVKVETDENIQPVIIASVENNVLTIKMKDSTSLSKMTKINIYVTVTELRKLSTEGVGKLRCMSRIEAKELELNCKGVGTTSIDLIADKLTVHSEIVGSMILAGRVSEVHIDHNGVGGIQAFNLQAEKLKLNLDGIGGAEVFASKELIIEAKGLGGIKYRGNPQVKNIDNKGIGKIQQVD
ncbi:MAG: DUF2807 domain-containing protein [Bacteroidota bacterium]|nr:DUF2807 domain-containing protein [Bacteroidota bacterium]